MLILNRPGYSLVIDEKGGEVKYPCVAEIVIELLPEEFFGVAPLSGKLGFVPVGCTLSVNDTTTTNYAGVGRLAVSGSYPVMDFSSKFLGTSFVIKGNHATFTVDVASQQEFLNAVWQSEAMFPTFFSGWLPAPIEIREIFGNLAGVAFSVKGSLVSSRQTLCTTEDLGYKKFFDEIIPDKLPIIPLVSAFRYLQQADRLETEGRHLTTFLAERILNLSKSLEAVFAGDIDSMRVEMRLQKLAEQYIDAFASIRHLRNQVDVGHVSFTELPPGTVEEIYKFTRTITECLRKYYCYLLKDAEAQQRISSSRNSLATLKAKDTVAYLRKHKNLGVPENYDFTRMPLS
jgi:hypothetical protein